MGHRGSDEKVYYIMKRCIIYYIYHTSFFVVVAIFRICRWFDGEILPNCNKSNFMRGVKNILAQHLK